MGERTVGPAWVQLIDNYKKRNLMNLNKTRTAKKECIIQDDSNELVGAPSGGVGEEDGKLWKEALDTISFLVSIMRFQRP